MYRMTAFVMVMLVAAAVIAVVVAIQRRRDARRDEAKRNPQWEVSERMFGGITYVTLELMARDGNWSHSYTSNLIGKADIASPDWQIELEILRERAEEKAAVLNEARNKSADAPP